jgi:fibronectin type 3 domain-containing protein
LISLSGTGEVASHEVDLSWDAPGSSSVSIVGYNVYRSAGGASSYQRMNSTAVTPTQYADKTVQSGKSYDYVVKSLDSAGAESAPSNVTSVAIP